MIIIVIKRLNIWIQIQPKKGHKYSNNHPLQPNSTRNRLSNTPKTNNLIFIKNPRLCLLSSNRHLKDKFHQLKSLHKKVRLNNTNQLPHAFIMSQS